MDKVIVTGLLVIAAVTGAVIVIGTLGPSISTSSQSVVESQHEAAGRIKTSIEIIAVSVYESDTKVDAWVKNVGVDTISAINKSDVFLIQTGTRFDAMVYMSGTLSGTKVWNGDLFEATPRKPWNRGDTLRITIKLSSADKVQTGDHVLRVSTPNGITADKAFSK